VHDEIESLKRDKNVLMLELVRLRQQQQVGSSIQLGTSQAAAQPATAAPLRIWLPADVHPAGVVANVFIIFAGFAEHGVVCHIAVFVVLLLHAGCRPAHA
jgi:hypothetical protein